MPDSRICRCIARDGTVAPVIDLSDDFHNTCIQVIARPNRFEFPFSTAARSITSSYFFCCSSWRSFRF